MTNMPDSLGNNDSTNAGSKSGHPNTEGALISKVSTISQADDNSEPLSGNLAEQKTGSQDRGIGSKKIKGSSMPARASNQDGEVLKKNEIADTGEDKEKTAKDLTWLQKMWAEIPKGSTKDWIKSIHTQETSWGDQGKLLWKQITQDGEIDKTVPKEKPKVEEGSIVTGPSTENLKIKYPKGHNSDNYFTNFEVKKQKYTYYMDNDNYHLLNSKSTEDDVEKQLYSRMVDAALHLNRIFPGIRGMTDQVCVLGESKAPTSEMRVDGTGTWVTCLFDNGADAATHTEVLSEAVELENLEDKIITMNTVNGSVRRPFEIKKIKIASKRKNSRENIIHAFSSAEVNKIGYQIGYMKAYVNIVLHILDMPPDLKRHFMDQCSDDQKEIQLILGQRGGGMLMHKVIPEQIGLKQHWLLPNLRIL